jgi:hypothetical protein
MTKHKDPSFEEELDQDIDRISAVSLAIRAADRLPVLTAREKTHGPFANNAKISQDLKQIFKSAGIFSAVPREALDMIATKLSRILSGHVANIDHWRDIAGYATLVVEALEADHE